MIDRLHHWLRDLHIVRPQVLFCGVGSDGIRWACSSCSAFSWTFSLELVPTGSIEHSLELVRPALLAQHSLDLLLGIGSDGID